MDFGQLFGAASRAFFGFEAAVFALAAVGLNVHFGYTGLLNFGQAGFMAVGAYGIGATVTYLGLSLWVGIAVGVALAVALGLLLGAPTLRLRADYLAITTIAASEIVRLIARSSVIRPVTGGSTGLTAFANEFYALNPLAPGSYGFGPLSYDHRLAWFLIVSWGLVAITSFALFILMRSPWGRILKSIREDEDAARSLGKNVYSYKMQSLVLGGVIGAMAGMLFATATQSVQPDTYQTQITFFAYTVLILGGTARIFGPILGSMIFWFLLAIVDVGLRQMVNTGVIPPALLSDEQVGITRFALVGLGLMLLMIFRPEGILGDRREIALDAR